MWGCCFAENQIAKCSGGDSLRVNTVLATQGHRLQQRRLFVENFYGPNHFSEWCAILKNLGQILS